MKRKSLPLTALFAATLALGIGSAQQPPAPPPPPPAPNAAPAPPDMPAQAVYSRRGNIKAFNSGPNGEINGFILNDGTAVLFPPEIGEQLRATAKEGSRIDFTGTSRSGVSGRMVVKAQTIVANGQTFTVAAAPAPPDGPLAPAGPGRGRGPRPSPAGGPAGGPPPPPPPPPGRGPAPPDGR